MGDVASSACMRGNEQLPALSYNESNTYPQLAGFWLRQQIAEQIGWPKVALQPDLQKQWYALTDRQIIGPMCLICNKSKTTQAPP